MILLRETPYRLLSNRSHHLYGHDDYARRRITRRYNGLYRPRRSPRLITNLCDGPGASLPRPVPVIRWHSLTVRSEEQLISASWATKSATFLASAIAADALLQEVTWLSGLAARAGDMDRHRVSRSPFTQRVMARTRSPHGGHDPRRTDRFWTLALRELDPRSAPGSSACCGHREPPAPAGIRDRPASATYGTAQRPARANASSPTDALSSQLSPLHPLRVTAHQSPIRTRPGPHRIGPTSTSRVGALRPSRGEASVVDPQFCRNEPFDRFAFTIDEGLPWRATCLPQGPVPGDTPVIVCATAGRRPGTHRVDPPVAEKLGYVPGCGGCAFCAGRQDRASGLSGDGCISIPGNSRAPHAH